MPSVADRGDDVSATCTAPAILVMFCGATRCGNKEPDKLPLPRL